MKKHISSPFGHQSFLTILLLIASGSLCADTFGSTVGTNLPAHPLTSERVAALPLPQRAEWERYLDHSEQARRADQAFLRGEMKKNGISRLIVPPEGRFHRSLPLSQKDSWYAGPEARHIAEVIVSFQTPAGGWSKNLNMTGNPRSPGMHFAPDNGSRFLEPSDFDTPKVRDWNYVGTFDNDATITQLRFLAKVIAASESDSNKSFVAAFQRGLKYIFASQFPNGGWPQVWPLQGGYHDAITYNDGAMVNILNLLRDVSQATNGFQFVPEPARRTAAKRVQRGLDCVLATQIVADGRRTVWPQQCDPLTLQPASARNYEMPSEATSESAGIMLFLMQVPHPDSKVIQAVNSAADWFKKTQILNEAFERSGGTGRHLVSAPGHGPLWSRYYEIGTDRPIFGDRDKTIHDNLDDISEERRNGYSWYTNTPVRALEVYKKWSQRH